MWLLDKIFNKSKSVAKYKMVQDLGNGFYTWNGRMYQSDIVSSCIRPKSKFAGKLVAKHIRRNENDLQVNPEPYLRILLEEPNPFMSFQVFLEKMTNQLEINNNAFALIIRDEFNLPCEIYPIPCLSVEAIYGPQGDLFLKFTLKNGLTLTFPYTDIIHIRQHFIDNDIFGESRIDSLVPLMDVITTTDQGIVKAIKNGNAIKWLLKFTSILKPEDINKATKEFSDNYLSIDNDMGGAAATDGKYDVQQVTPNDYVPNAAILDRTITRLYNIFGTNEKIIQNKFNEDEWNAYFEGEIEPLAMQLSNEFSRKLFTKRERAFGNKIIFEAATLQYASMNTKLQLVQMVDRGSLTPNEWRDIFNLAPVPGGDKPIRRLDTAVVDVKGGEK